MFNFLKENTEYKELRQALDIKSRSISVRNICDSGKVFLTSTFTGCQKLIVMSSEEDALYFFNEYKFYDKNIYYYEEKDLLFDRKNLDSEEIDKNRFNILNRLVNKEKITVVTTVSSLLEIIPNKSRLVEDMIFINTNDQIVFDDFISRLISLGYKRVDEVEKAGEISVHGGIIDIFDLLSDNPIRIEFFGDEVDSIRYFDLNTRRTIEIVGDVKISPYFNNPNNEENLNNIKNPGENASLLDYFDEDRIIFIDEPKRIIERIKMTIDMLTNFYDTLFNNEVIDLPRNEEEIKTEYDSQNKMPEILDGETVLDNITAKRCIQLTSFDDPPYINRELADEKGLWDLSFELNMTTPIFNKRDFEDTLREIKMKLESGYCGIIVISSHLRGKRFVEELEEAGLNIFYDEENEVEVHEKNVSIVPGILKTGFISNTNKFFVLSEKDIFGIEIERKKTISKAKKRIRQGFEEINDITKLEIGDYIVHETFGVGIFKGIKHLTSDSITKDYVALEYADGGNLYLLATKLEVIQKFASKNADPPKLNKLNNNDFIKNKKKAKEEVFYMAKDLIELYAARLNNKGYKYNSDTIWQQEFEETFPYIETVDQLTAIEEVKKDMESDKTMDRLICGDVGFGKTEVAIRAAFKALQDGKQVAYLVPTTVLCMQHFKTFKERFEKYPINIDYLSRFKTVTENKKTIEKIKKGQIDIIIGTHRLLSEDVAFRDLGLLIIDEEQRFGVSHKEKIKKLKNNVDVISMSATPIPRTLYMSLSGIRDISIMKEAPKDRMPIKTYVLEYNEELIKEAVNRELNRGGQVFIVHNKVQDIYDFADKISKLIPRANISIAHGKLDEKELSKVMIDFIDKKTNILISTTIIETGIDIQNANTLIIDEADKFGMSQLYQLRGRVGRSDRTAYAFLMYKRDKVLSEISEKRLKAIKEFTSLGSGMKIAMRDLEIRGAGSVLGTTQSGHIEAIGYELYCKYLNNVLKLLKESGDASNTMNDDCKNINYDNIKENFIEGYDTTVDVDINAFIPKNYIESDESKLDIYRKISKAEKNEEFKEIEEELKDRFGDTPKEIKNLIDIAKLKIKSKNKYITDLTIKSHLLRIVFYEKAKLNVDTLFKIVDEFAGILHFSNDDAPTLTYRADSKEKPNIEKVIKMANYIIEKLD